NGRHEIAQMPMTEHWQARQRRGIGFGIDRYIEIGLVVILVSGRKSGADISGGVCVPRRESGQSREIEVVRPAAHGRGREFATNQLSLDGAERNSGIAEPCRKLGQRIGQAGRAIGRALETACAGISYGEGALRACASSPRAPSCLLNHWPACASGRPSREKDWT